MSDWSTTLGGFLDMVWARLVRSAADPKAPARRVVLATHGQTGWPEARMVVLRAADRPGSSVAVHTDNASTKIAEITANPRAALHAWEPRLNLQTRLRGEISIETGAAVRDVWPRVPDGSRSSYGVTPAPGSAIPTADAYTRAADFERFAVLTLKIEEIDTVHLAPDYHRRALYRRLDGWQGTWRAP